MKAFQFLSKAFLPKKTLLILMLPFFCACATADGHKQGEHKHALKKHGKSEGFLNILLDRKLNIRMADSQGKGPERCLEPEQYKRRYESAKTKKERAAIKDQICVVYQKPLRKLDQKNFSITLHEGSFVLTLIDDNGVMFQYCYDDNWARVDCQSFL